MRREVESRQDELCLYTQGKNKGSFDATGSSSKKRKKRGLANRCRVRHISKRTQGELLSIDRRAGLLSYLFLRKECQVRMTKRFFYS